MGERLPDLPPGGCQTPGSKEGEAPPRSRGSALIWARPPGSSREIWGLPPGRDSLLSFRRMATTHDNITRLRPRPGSPEHELEEEVRAVTRTVRENAERRARRKAAWGIHPWLAYASITAASIALAVISWVTGGIVGSYDDPGKGGGYVPPTSEPAPITTVTGTTVESDQ